VSITGAKRNVLKFAQRFIYEREGDDYPDVPFFAKSVAHTTRSEAIEEIEEIFRAITEEIELTATLYVGFAWSAHDCLINISTQKYPECIALMDACIQDSVAVEIKAVEETSGFEESIYCGKDGKLDSQMFDMQKVACEHCGTENTVPSFSKASECECSECGEKLITDSEEGNADANA
jgi:ribosomal protein S27E